MHETPEQRTRRARRAEWFAFLRERRDLAAIAARLPDASEEVRAEARAAEAELHAAMSTSDEDEWFERDL